MNRREKDLVALRERELTSELLEKHDGILVFFSKLVNYRIVLYVPDKEKEARKIAEEQYIPAYSVHEMAMLMVKRNDLSKQAIKDVTDIKKVFGGDDAIITDIIDKDEKDGR
jgi:hypothetical protein